MESIFLVFAQSDDDAMEGKCWYKKIRSICTPDLRNNIKICYPFLFFIILGLGNVSLFSPTKVAASFTAS